MTDDAISHFFLQDLAIILGLAALVTVLFQRLKLPVVAGYLMAGVALGPQMAVGLIHDPATVRTLAEIGVVLLLMFVGLEIRFRRLVRIGPRVGVAVVIETGLMMVLGFAVAKALDWSRLESLLAAGIVAISSTAVIAKAYEEHSADWRLRDLVFSLLVFEDLVAIVLVAIGTTVAVGGVIELDVILSLFGKLAVLLVVMLVGGMLVIPPVIRAVVRLGRRETTLVTGVGVTFLLALVTQKAGYSVALGAFVAGMLMSESGVGHQIGEVVRPVRDLFAAVFFVAVGMLLDVGAALQAWPLVLLFTAVVVFGKIAGISVGAFVTGFGTRTSVRAALSMAQIGEFSFIIAGLGLTVAGAAPLYSIAVSTAILTAFLTPFLVKGSEGIALWVDRRLPRPLQTFSSLYGAWLDTLSTRAPGAQTPWHRGRRQIWLLVVDATLVALIMVATSLAWRADPAFFDRFGVSRGVGRIGVLVVGAVLALPFGLGLVLAGRRLARLLAEAVVPAVAPGRVDQGRSPRRVLEISLELAMTLVVGIPLVGATLPFLPPFGAPGVILALLALLGFAFWRTARDLDSHARAGAELVVHVLARQGDTGQADSFSAVREMLPGLGDFEPVRIEAGMAAEGRTLGELNLRGRTGATIVALSRGGERLVFPAATARLDAGDLIALTGSHQAIAEARALIRSPKSSGGDALASPAARPLPAEPEPTPERGP